MSTSSPRTGRTIELLTKITLCVALLCVHLPLRAQPGLRTVTGTVTDTHHEPLAGAVVQLQDDNTGSVISYLTNRTGRFIFKRLSTDDNYHVSATFRDRHSRSKFISKFDSKPSRNLSLVIRPR